MIQIRFDLPKKAKKPRKDHLELKCIKILPDSGKKAALPSWYALPYHPTSGRELKSSVIFGTAVAMMAVSRKRSPAASVIENITRYSGAPVIYAGLPSEEFPSAVFELSVSCWVSSLRVDFSMLCGPDGAEELISASGDCDMFDWKNEQTQLPPRKARRAWFNQHVVQEFLNTRGECAMALAACM